MTLTAPAPPADVYEAEEIRGGARALLRHPMILAGGKQDEEFRVIRRHREALAHLFSDALGYRLLVDSRTARLFKAGLGTDPSRPLRRRNDTAFTPRTYALLCLALAAVTRRASC